MKERSLRSSKKKIEIKNKEFKITLDEIKKSNEIIKITKKDFNIKFNIKSRTYIKIGANSSGNFIYKDLEKIRFLKGVVDAKLFFNEKLLFIFFKKIF
jgi:hypothetical protein